jgi:hypothetical protein
MEVREAINGKRVLLGVSGGINSAAVLVWLIQNGIIPSELHLYYAHFKQHSPDTAKFVTDLIRYARKSLPNVKVRITRNDVIDFFRKEKIIPHPVISPCSVRLKIRPIDAYCFHNRIEVDLIGYVKSELKRRSSRAYNPQTAMFEADKVYPIGNFDDEWCFEIVKQAVGWYPKIYDLIDSNGKRLFKHNNCLPCKNMTNEDLELVKQYFPWHWQEAMRLSVDLSRHWGRDSAEFYTTFGRPELGQESTCETCKW